MRYLYLLALILALHHNLSFAEVVYDEAVDGDLPGWEEFSQPLPVFTVVDFVPGLNEVVGTTPWRFDSPDPSDAIQFTVGANEILQLSVSEVIVGNAFNEKVAWVWELVMEPLAPFGGTKVAYHVSNSVDGYGVPVTHLPTSFGGLTIGPGEYLLYNNFRFSDPEILPAFDPDLLHLDYTFEFRVSTVPLPPSFALLVPAVLLLRRNRGSTQQ